MEVLTEVQFRSIVDAIRTNSKRSTMNTESHYTPGSMPVEKFEGILAKLLSLDKTDDRISTLCKQVSLSIMHNIITYCPVLTD